MGIEMGAVGLYGQNFDTHPDYRHDMFYMVQNVARGIGDIRSGKANDFLDRAYAQNWMHTEDELARLQDKFLEDDMINNTPGRGQRNYRRMEYDIEKNPNGKGAAEDRKLAEERTVLPAEKVLGLMRQHLYAMCTTASAVKSTPIKQKDYDGQIKLR
jgi:hypothetical protein